MTAAMTKTRIAVAAGMAVAAVAAVAVEAAAAVAAAAAAAVSSGHWVAAVAEGGGEDILGGWGGVNCS